LRGGDYQIKVIEHGIKNNKYRGGEDITKKVFKVIKKINACF